MKMNMNVGVGLVLALMTFKVQAHIALWDEAMYGYVLPTIHHGLIAMLITDGTPLM